MAIQEVDEDAEEDAEEEVEEVDAFSPIVRMPGEVVEEEIINEDEEVEGQPKKEDKVDGLGISNSTNPAASSLGILMGNEKLSAVVESAATTAAGQVGGR